MLIARTKRKENIAEYILYLWQLEDLLRALQFSPEAIWSTLVSRFDVDEDQKQEIFLWYMELSTLLRQEGKEAHGHLDHTLHLIDDLEALHRELLQLPVGEAYREAFARLAPELPALRKTMDKPDIKDIELCFRALYAVMLYRIKASGKDPGHQDDEIPKQIADTLELISPVIATLAALYGKAERGEIDLSKAD